MLLSVFAFVRLFFTYVFGFPCLFTILPLVGELKCTLALMSGAIGTQALYELKAKARRR